MHLTLSQTHTRAAREGRPLAILDPMAGRGTTLLTAWRGGHNAFGVENDLKSVEALEAFLKSYLRRNRIKHTATMSPVRREGKNIGKRFDAEAKGLQLTVMTGDTRNTAKLFGKHTFDAIITDAPYGVVHGATNNKNRTRSPKQLLNESVKIWVSRLRSGGAIGISWNTYGMSRAELADLLTENGLKVADSEPWQNFSHRVDASINRDLIVATKLD